MQVSVAEPAIARRVACGPPSCPDRCYAPAVATVHLHIGTMKSGTSFLQYTCTQSRDVLAAAGIRYLGRAARPVHDLLGGQTHREVGAWQRLAREVRRSTTDTLISNELLCPLPLKKVRRVATSFAPHDLHLMLTVRDLTKVVPSHWQERIQNGSLVGWTEFCETAAADPRSSLASRKFWRHHDVVRVIARWSQVIPADRITIVTVPPTSENPGLLWQRFLSAIGVENVDSTRLPARGNPSLGAVSAELLLRVNTELTDLAWRDRTRSVKHVLAKEVLASRASSEPRYVLSPEHYKLLRARAISVVDGIRATGVRVIGDLDEVVPAEEPPTVSGIDPGDITDSQLLEAAVTGLAGVCRQLTKYRNAAEEIQLGRDMLRSNRRRRDTDQDQPPAEREGGRAPPDAP